MRYKIGWVLGCIAVLSTTARAQADRWVAVGTDADGIIYLDQTTVQMDGPIRTVWFKSVYSPPRQVLDMKLATTLEHDQFDCTNRTTLLMTYVMKDSKDSVLATGPRTRNPPLPVAPETIGEVELNFVCRLTTVTPPHP